MPCSMTKALAIMPLSEHCAACRPDSASAQGPAVRGERSKTLKMAVTLMAVEGTIVVKGWFKLANPEGDSSPV